MENDIGLRDIARLVAPDSEIASSSNPEPVLRAYNVVAVYHEEEDSRDAVLALESIEDDDAAIGLVSLADEADSPTGMKPEDRKITGETLRRTAIGGAIGAVVGALIIGLGVLPFSTSMVAIGAGVGGALFGAFIGGLWGAFVKFGGSDAYRQSFTLGRHPVTLVSLHTNDFDHAQEAQGLLGLIADTTPTMVRRDGGRIWAE